MKCSICDINKPKKGVELEGKKVFLDPTTNKHWNKNECPECSELNLDDPTPKTTSRKCRDCGKFMDSTRYFICMECKPELESIDEDYLYDDLDNIDIDEEFFEHLQSPQTVSEFNWLINSDRVTQKKKEDIILGANEWKKLK